MVVVARHQALIAKLGLSTLAGAKAFTGERVKDHKGRRDILRIRAGNFDDGRPLVLYCKRIWKPYRKDGLFSVVRHGSVWSLSKQEWTNSQALEAAGIRVAPLVAFGEECGPLWERFSFLVTEAAAGRQTLEQFLQECRDPQLRRRVFAGVALEIRKMHAAGLATPDLFTRHLFVEAEIDPPRFSLIDMARLDRRRVVSERLRARDLAALNITAPLRRVSAKERLRFLQVYAGSKAADRSLVRQIARRTKHLLQRKKFRKFTA